MKKYKSTKPMAQIHTCELQSYNFSIANAMLSVGEGGKRQQFTSLKVSCDLQSNTVVISKNCNKGGYRCNHDYILGVA